MACPTGVRCVPLEHEPPKRSQEFRGHIECSPGSAMDDRPTRKMEALDLRLLAEAAGSQQRPTGKMERLDLASLLAAPEATPCVQLRVITTPPELRARWETWVRIRASFALCVALMLVLVTVVYLA